MNGPRIVAAGDSTLVVEFEARIDPVINERAIRLAGRLRAADIAGVRDVVPTYRSVAVCFDPLRTRYDDLLKCLEHESRREDEAPPERSAPIQVPVCYGGELGPDLDGVAELANMSPEQVVAVHSSQIYRVYMLGFLPGFAYMGLVDPRMPCRDTRPAPLVSKGRSALPDSRRGFTRSRRRVAGGSWAAPSSRSTSIAPRRSCSAETRQFISWIGTNTSD